MKPTAVGFRAIFLNFIAFFFFFFPYYFHQNAVKCHTIFINQYLNPEVLSLERGQQMSWKKHITGLNFSGIILHPKQIMKALKDYVFGLVSIPYCQHTEIGAVTIWEIHVSKEIKVKHLIQRPSLSTYLHPKPAHSPSDTINTSFTQRLRYGVLKLVEYLLFLKDINSISITELYSSRHH